MTTSVQPMTFTFSEAGKAMFMEARKLAGPEQVARIRSDLPVYIGAGEQDPVNAGLALMQPLVDRLQAAGLKDITVHTYAGARHEVFNETNRAEVAGDLLAWLSRITE